MADLRTLAEAAIAARGTDTWTSNALVEAEEAFYGAANPRAVIGLLDERDAYRAFAVSIARMVASPGAEDTADKLTAADLDMVYNLACAEYGNGHAAGDRDRFARCKEDLARALGLDVRRAPEWGEMVGRVRDVVRRADVAAARWEWTHDPESMSFGLSFRGPGDVCPKSVASVCWRPEWMWSVHILGQKRTAADDLPAALATIRAVLGGDVPEIPNERSES